MIWEKSNQVSRNSVGHPKRERAHAVNSAVLFSTRWIANCSSRCDIQKQKGLPLTLKSECHTDWKSEGIIAIRPVPVFITSSAAGLNAALHSSKASLGKEAVVVASRVDQMKTEPTALDHWTLNLLLSVGCDVISQCGIKKSTHKHKRSPAVFCAAFEGHCRG